MSSKNPLEPEVFIAKNREEILAATGSKYCPVAANAKLKDILTLEGKFAVVGLPCHIHGVRKFEHLNKKLKDKIILHLGIFCANTVTFNGTINFLSKNGIKVEDVEKIQYRGEGWPGKVVVILNDHTKKVFLRGTSEKNFFKRISFYSSFHYDFMPIRCLLCRDLTNELSDISFGDPWLPELLKTEKIGKSLIIVRNNVGIDIIQKCLAAKKIDLQFIEYSTFLRAQNFGFKQKWNSRVFWFNKFRKPVPDYGIEISKAKISDLLSLYAYLPSFFSHKKVFWPVIRIYAIIRNFLNIPLSWISKYI